MKKNIKRARSWVYSKIFISLGIFQRQLQTNCSWFKWKAVYTDPKAIQQIVFQRVAGGANDTKTWPYTILEKSKETALEFYKGTAKVLSEYVNGWIH